MAIRDAPRARTRYLPRRVDVTWVNAALALLLVATIAGTAYLAVRYERQRTAARSHQSSSISAPGIETTGVDHSPVGVVLAGTVALSADLVAHAAGTPTASAAVPNAIDGVPMTFTAPTDGTYRLIVQLPTADRLDSAAADVSIAYASRSERNGPTSNDSASMRLDLESMSTPRTLVLHRGDVLSVATVPLNTSGQSHRLGAGDVDLRRVAPIVAA